MTIARAVASGIATIGGAFQSIGSSYAWALRQDRHAFAALEHDLPEIAAELKAWARTQNPEPVFALLRVVKPILVLPDMAIVTRFEDVQEVLSRPDAFGVPYAEKFAALTGGRNFFLGMSDSPEYTRDVANMRVAIRRTDIPAIIQPIVRRTADAIVAQGAGRVNVVTDLGVHVTETVAAEYFGTPSPAAGEFAAYAATISGFLFLPSGTTPGVEVQAVQQAKVMRAAMRAELERRRATSDTRDDVLGRCIAMQASELPGMDDDMLLVNMFGIVVGALPTTTAILARALDELLRRPIELEQAQVAARAGATSLVWKYLAECLRFNPLGPGVFRTALDDYEVASGTLRRTVIPRGHTVLVALQSAMMDSNNLDDPEIFKADRPDWQYMHFGYGMHTCFGQYINVVQVALMAETLLRQRNFRRADGDDGTLVLDGPFPASLVVNYDA